MPPHFELDGVSVLYGGRPALDALDLSIAPGEAVALVGPSGAGKTTLLRLLNGARRPDRGIARVGGVDLARLSPRALRAARARVGFVHQDHALIPVLRVVQNVTAGRLGSRGVLAGLRGVLLPGRSDAEAVHALLERLGIADKLFQRTDTLSGGEQQRVALARALYQGPEALLADEPVASLDPARGRDLVALLCALAREEGLTLVTSLHDLELARAFFPRLIGLRGGRIVVDGPPKDLTPARLADLYRLERDGHAV